MSQPKPAREGQVLSAAFGNGQHVTIGTLSKVDASRVPWVRFPGDPGMAVPARLVGDCAGAAGSDVAIAFEGGDRSRPIVLGVLRSAWPLDAETETPLPGRDVLIDGRRLELTADTEIVLRCGNASIVLRRDGKLVIKGTEVVSRASGSNKIRGGQVNIN